jgi:hypothetical protein
MPTINKVSFATLRTLSFKGSQSQNVSMPIASKQGLQRDTISFKAHEKEFLETLNKLYGDGNGDRDVEADLQLWASFVDPNHPDIVARYKKIEESTPSSYEEACTNKWVLGDLREMLGNGKAKKVYPKWGKDWSKE